MDHDAGGPLRQTALLNTKDMNQIVCTIEDNHVSSRKQFFNVVDTAGNDKHSLDVNIPIQRANSALVSPYFQRASSAR